MKQRRPDGVDVIELGWELANNNKAIVYKKAPGFRAIDGTTFDNERALRKYMYETFLLISQYKNNKDLVKRDGENWWPANVFGKVRKLRGQAAGRV